MSYQRLNQITGWTVFLLTTVVYLLTMSPTASFWDCGEFIACSHELEVTHPPGAPLFLILGRLFSMLALGNAELVAWMVNLMSALAGSFTALFTFWTVTMLAKKGLANSTLTTKEQHISIMFAGVVAAFSCAFADSLWFNAVEAEVYAMSSFFTAAVVWLMFKWEERADEPDHLRWVILIAYVMGLSIGVHLLNLLAIPAMALLFFFRKYRFSWLGLFATLGISVAILAFLQYGVIQETFSVALEFERILTGTVSRTGEDLGGMGFPVGTGATVFALLIIGVIVGLLVISHKRKWVALNTSVLGLAVILIGFSSYSAIFIRSNVNTPIDMNNPENILTFLSYMRREQYGERPLVRGPLYNGQIKRDSRGRAISESDGMKYILLPEFKKYVEDTEKIDYVYRDQDIVWFPRMWSIQKYNAGPFGYINYVEKKGQDPQSPYDDRPTKADDWTFFFDYQLNHMYFRYFMWNFVGRTGDQKEDGWEDGLFKRTHSRSDNKANNHYFFLPLLLGLFGFFWQSTYRRNDAFVIGLLFLFTGIAIIVYLNQYPNQPRERDYSFAGSFQTFAIWIGLGVLFLVELLGRYLKRLTPWLTGAFAMMIPLVMLVQNWDDHTRKGRWVDIEFAKNLLDSCEENGILFTGGDNDTFPLWYVQEVEGYRTDVRIVNLELLISDWYIDQMREPMNGALPVPINMNQKDYAGEKDIVIRGFPSQKIILPADTTELLKNGVLNPQEIKWMNGKNKLEWEFKARGGSRNAYILRKDSVMINILRNVAEDGWKRPVYFANTIGSGSFLNLNDYLRMEGLAYRVVPVKKSENTPNDPYFGWISQEKTEKALREVFLYTDLDNPSVNFDEHIRQSIIGNYRNVFFRLANTYGEKAFQLRKDEADIILAVERGEIPRDSVQGVLAKKREEMEFCKGKIRELMKFSEEKIPSDVIPVSSVYRLTKFQLLDRAGLNEEAAKEVEESARIAIEKMALQKKDGYQIDNRGAEMQAAAIGIQYFSQKNREKAESIAQLLFDETGSTLGLQVLQQN